MVLAYQNTGEFAKAVFGDASQQHVGANGAIAMASPSAPVAIKGGKSQRNKSQRNKSQRNKSQRNKSQRNKKGGKSQKNQRKNKNQR